MILMPKRCVKSTYELNPEELSNIYRLAEYCSKNIESKDSSVIGFKFGAVLGTSSKPIPLHLSFHLIPTRKSKLQKSSLLSLWAFIGMLWGLCFGFAVRYSNHNYEIIKSTIQGVDTGAPFGPMILAFTLSSMIVFLLLLIIGIFTMRKKKKFWGLMLGILVGFSISGMLR